MRKLWQVFSESIDIYENKTDLQNDSFIEVTTIKGI
jgi:hypothetical protein